MSYERQTADVTDTAKADSIEPPSVTRWWSLGARGLDYLFPWCCLHCERVIRPFERGEPR